MTNERKWNLERYEQKRQPGEECLDNALLCEAIAAGEIMSEPLEAIYWQKEALKIREKLYGKNSIENVVQYERLAEYYLENGNPKSALPFGKKILKIREKVLGNTHIEIAKSYLILSDIYSNAYLRDNHKALECATLAAEIETVNRCFENPISYKTHLQLAYLYGFRHFKDYCPDEAEPVKNVEDAGLEKEHYQLAMESAIQEYGENSVEAAICYQRYVHIVESCQEKRLALSAKALEIFYQAEGAVGSNTHQVAADIWYSWMDVHWFPWDKSMDKGIQNLDRKTIGYGIKWIAENVSKEIADKLVKTFDSKDQEMIYEILQSLDPVPPAIK